VACEFSGRVRDAFAALGHDAWSADLVPTRAPGQHYQGDARDLLAAGAWDLLIAHPPCTYLAKSGVHWLHSDPTRWAKMRAGAEFFRDMLDAPVSAIAVENPIPHRYAMDLIGGPDQIVQPYEFGADTSKRTGLWLRGLPPLLATYDARAVAERNPLRDQTNSYRGSHADRGYARSVTCMGLAIAMAEQWGGIRPAAAVAS